MLNRLGLRSGNRRGCPADASRSLAAQNARTPPPMCTSVSNGFSGLCCALKLSGGQTASYMPHLCEFIPFYPFFAVACYGQCSAQNLLLQRKGAGWWLLQNHRQEYEGKRAVCWGGEATIML